MIVKKRALFQIITSLICTTLLQAEISPTSLRGMSTCMTKGYEQYSPALGALYWNSPFIRNTFEFRSSSAPLTQLARELFFVHHDGITFDITRSSTKIAHYYTPKDIGTIIGYLHVKKHEAKEAITDLINRIKKEKNDEIKASIIQGLKTTIARQTTYLSELLDKIIAEGMWDSKKQSLLKAGKNLDTEWQRIIENMRKAHGQENWGKVMSIIKGNPLEGQFTRNVALISQNQLFLKLEEEQSTIAHKYFKEDAHDFASIITQAYETEPSITIGFLLAWLWKYANVKEDFIEYLRALDLIISEHGEHIFNPQTFMQKPYSYEDFKQLNNILSNPIEQLPTLEELIFYRYSYNLYMAQLPGIISMTGAVRSICKEPFSDCGETSLRNFFNALLYNPLNQAFDIELLKKLNATQSLIDFYLKYPTAEHIHTFQAHNDWARVVSGLPDVKYKRENTCEISSANSGCENMQKVIKNLLPDIDSFQTLAERLEQYGISILIEGTPSNNPCILSFHITKPDQHEFKIDWEFLAGHFVIHYPEAELFKNDYIISTLANQIKKGILPYNIYDMVILLSQFTTDINMLLRETIPSHSINTLLLYPLNTPEKKIKFTQLITQFLIDNPTLMPDLKSMVLNIYTTLPQDFDTMINFSQSVMLQNSALLEVQKDLLKIIQDPTSILEFTLEILSLKDTTTKEQNGHMQYLYEWLLKNIGKIEPVHNVAVIQSILQMQFDEDTLKQPYIQQLLQWVLNNITQVGPMNIARALDAVIDLNIPVNEISLPFITHLHNWLIQTLKTESISLKRIYVQKIVEQRLQDEHTATLKNLLTDKIIRDIAPLSPSDTSMIMYIIIRAQIPNSDCGKKALQELYRWIFDTLKNLPDDKIRNITSELIQKRPQLKYIVSSDQWDKINKL